MLTTNQHRQSQFSFGSSHTQPATVPVLTKRFSTRLSDAAAAAGSLPSGFATKSQRCDITTGMRNGFADGAGWGGGREKQKFSLGKINSPTAYSSFARVSLRLGFLLGRCKKTPPIPQSNSQYTLISTPPPPDSFTPKI